VVRKYKRKPGRVSPDRRMARAAELRAQGLSLRQIATRLSCHHDTIWRDLARWDAAHRASNVSDLPVGKVPPRGENPTSQSDSTGLEVISLSDRRKRA